MNTGGRVERGCKGRKKGEVSLAKEHGAHCCLLGVRLLLLFYCASFAFLMISTDKCYRQVSHKSNQCHVAQCASKRKLKAKNKFCFTEGTRLIECILYFSFLSHPKDLLKCLF